MKEAGPILLCPAFIIRYESAAIFRLSYEFTSSGFNPFINLFNPKAPLTANPDSRNIFSRTDPRANGHGTDTKILRQLFNGYPLMGPPSSSPISFRIDNHDTASWLLRLLCLLRLLWLLWYLFSLVGIILQKEI